MNEYKDKKVKKKILKWITDLMKSELKGEYMNGLMNKWIDKWINEKYSLCIVLICWSSWAGSSLEYGNALFTPVSRADINLLSISPFLNTNR